MKAMDSITVVLLAVLVINVDGFATIRSKHSDVSLRASSVINTSPSDDEYESTDKQSITSSSFNLIKGCVGSGVLSLPAGVAAIGDVPQALVPALIILIILGVISAYTFHLIGRLTAVVSSDSGDDGHHISSLGNIWDFEVGTSTSWLVSLAVMLTCFGTSLSYSIILGDTIKSLVETAGISNCILTSRRFNVAAIALLGIYPLSCLKSLAALAPVSLAGVAGIIVTCIVMTIRALPGHALTSLPVQPSFGIVGLRRPQSLLVVSSMTATAFLAHMSSPEFFQTLKDNTISRFGKLSIIGFGFTALISAFMMSIGFLTFGGACKGMILNNYSIYDHGATLCRALMAISLLGSYAFLGNAMKKAFYQIFYKGQEISDKIHYRTTRLFVSTLTALALLINDAGFVVSVTGAVLGSALIYMIPSFLFIKQTSRRIASGKLVATKRLKIERWFNMGLIGLGTFLALAGAYMSILNSFFPHLL